MIGHQVIKAGGAYYPFGNTPAVSLTQDLPPEQDADILTLGCGDARNVLFTCFVDAARKIDVTCCDWEPGVLARNVLLYTLIMEDKANENIEYIWSIYYHLKIDKETLNQLEIQTAKLLQYSESIDQWHSSVYGSSIRFYDAKSLSLVRSYWFGFRLQSLPHSEKACRLRQLKAAIDRTILKKKVSTKGGVNSCGLRATSPVGLGALEVLREVSNHWWDHGTMPSKTVSALKATNLNPALLYSPNPSLTLYSGLEPLLGFPLSPTFSVINKESAIYPKQKSATSAEHLVDCAKSLFAQWALSFRKAVANESVIRIFCGDALAFCITLRNRQLKSVNMHCDSGADSCFEPLDNRTNNAPLSFDVIDTSNLVDHLGPLNVTSVASSLLKYNASSTLYTEILVQRDSSLTKRLSGFFGVDIRCLSLLLGLVSPELFTNAMDSFEEDPVITGSQKMFLGAPQQPQYQARTRLRWRRLQGCAESRIQIEEKPLAGFLVQLHNAMFKHEDLDLMGNMLTCPSPSPSELLKFGNPPYNRASFALLLSILKATVATDWDQCVKFMYDGIFRSRSLGSVTPYYSEDLLLNMHFHGVDNGTFIKPAPDDVNGAILAPILPFSGNKDVPELLWVTVRVPRENLNIFTSKDVDEIGSPTLFCSFVGGDPGEEAWFNDFSTIRFTFGKRHQQTKEGDSHPYIVEDSSGLQGTSDMFVSVMVPTRIILRSKQNVPQIKCRLIFTPQTLKAFIYSKVLESDLCFACCKVTSDNVFITRHMPGVSTAFAFTPTSAPRDKPTTSVACNVRLLQNASKVDVLVQRIIVESEAAAAELAIQSSMVEIKFQNPLKACVTIAQAHRFELEFPVPVSPSNYKLRIARKTGYIEVEAPLFDPLVEDAALFVFPVSIIENPCGATIPVPWTSTFINLDAMPSIVLEDTRTTSWLIGHASLMFSDREQHIRKSKSANSSSTGTQVDTRTDLKDSLFSILMYYTGLQGQQAEFFGLRETDCSIQTLFFPSCLRLDLVNHTVVLDIAMIPVTKAMSSDLRAVQFLEKLSSDGLCEVKVSQAESHAWRTMMPALVERCRTIATWKHVPGCEYIQAGEVPLPKGSSQDYESPICSCGVGKFPKDYLQSLMKKLPDLRYIVEHYATRIALAPVFAVPYVEDCTINDLPQKVGFFAGPVSFQLMVAKLNSYFINRGMLTKEKCVVKEKCVKCKRENDRAGEQSLLRCSRCKLVRYCSKECQKGDWKKHKPFCSAA